MNMSKIRETLDKLYRLWGELPEVDVNEDLIYFESRSQLVLDDAREFKPVIELLTSLIQIKNSQVLDLYIWSKDIEVFYCNKLISIQNVLTFSGWVDTSLDMLKVHIPLGLYPFFKKFFSWKREVRLYATEMGVYLFMVEQPKTKQKDEVILQYFIPNKPGDCTDLLEDYERITRYHERYLRTEEVVVEGVSYNLYTIKTLEEI